MILKDIAEKTAEKLGITVDMSVSGDEQSLLTACAKEVLLRLTGEITDVQEKKKVVAENGIIAYANVDADYKRALRLMKKGKKATFRETSAGILVEEDGEYDLTYAYFVQPTALNGTVKLPPKFSVNVLALGAAGEYCYRKGLYKECETYDDRFTSALKSLLSTTKSVTLKAVDE